MTTQACKTSAIVEKFNLPNLEVDNSRNYAIVKIFNVVLVEVFSTDSGLTMIESIKSDQVHNTCEVFIEEAITEALHIAYMEFKQGQKGEVATYDTWLRLDRIGS